MMTIVVSDTLIRRLREARSVCVLTGAGVSAESGLPTFRDALSGLWARFRPEDLATPAAFRRDPALIWEWYAWRRAHAQEAAPNPAHFALAELERRVPDFTLVTQNVDGLHARAGSVNLVELHGSLHRARCLIENVEIDLGDAESSALPRCPNCGALLRPAVVWFGESLPPAALQTALDAAARCDVFLTVGTSGLVHPAASLPLFAARAGAAVVTVNPDASPGPFSLRGAAGVVLPALLAAAWPQGGE